METLLPHPSPSEGGQNAWNQNYMYIFEVIDTNKPNINYAEINTSNVRAGFNKKNWLCIMRDRVKARQKKVSRRVLTQKDHVRYKSKSLPVCKEHFEFCFSCQYMSLGGAKNLRIYPLFVGTQC